MYFYEHGQELLMAHGFTPQEADDARKAVAKNFAEAASIRERFVRSGGNEIEWSFIERCLKGFCLATWNIERAARYVFQEADKLEEHGSPQQRVFALLADSDGTMRSTDALIGVAVTTEAEAVRYVNEKGMGYTHSYQELTVFDDKNEALEFSRR